MWSKIITKYLYTYLIKINKPGIQLKQIKVY